MSTTGYIGSDNLDIATKMSSKTMGTENNVWSGIHEFARLSTACQIVNASTTITNIPNVIIITAATVTLTFPSTMPAGIILCIRRTIAGTTTFNGPVFYTKTNTTMTTSTALVISLASCYNNWYMLI